MMGSNLGALGAGFVGESGQKNLLVGHQQVGMGNFIDVQYYLQPVVQWLQGTVSVSRLGLEE